MNIRLCNNEAELQQCAELMYQSEPWQTLGFSPERCIKSLRGDYKELYIAETDGAFAGFVILQLYGVLRGYIQTICIEPSFRGQGIGTALLQFSDARIQRMSPNVFICVSSFNHRAAELYRRLGYEQVGVLKDHIVRGHDEYLLRKSLAPFNEFVPVE